jgi:hypothetical protein
MKSLIVILFLLMAEEATAQRCAVAIDRENTVYAGIPNALTIAVEGHSSKNIVVKTRQGELETVEGGRYYLNEKNAGMDTLEVFVRSKAGLKAVDTFMIRVKQIPAPVAKIANKQGGKIAKEMLNAQIGIITVQEGFDFDARPKVKSFSMVVLRNDQVIFVHKNVNASFDASIQKFFKQQLLAGDKLAFINIHAIGADGTDRQLQAIELTVTD